MHLGQALSFMNSVLTMTSDGQISSFRGFDDTTRSSSEALQVGTEKVSHTSMSQSAKSTIPVLLTSLCLKQASKDAARQTGDWRLYQHYILSIGWWRFAILLVVHAVDAALVNFPSQLLTHCPFCLSSANLRVAVWLKQWSEAEEQSPKGRTPYYLGVYGAVSLVGLLTVILMIW